MSEATSVSGRSGGLSETSSRAEANEYLRKRHRHATSQEEEDLLEQNKTLQEAVFSSMYTLVKAKTAESWKMAVVKVVLEALVPFLVVFNPTMGWAINTSNPVWQLVRWALPRSPIARIWGYGTYLVIFYAIVAVIFTVLLAVAGLTIAMRKQEHSKWLLRFARLLQRVTELLFSVFYVAVFDYVVFLFSCNFGSPGQRHSYWPEVECLSTKNIVVLAVAGVTAIVFFLATACVLIASCELNPVSTAIMASPAAVTRLRILSAKALFVIFAGTLGSQPRIQAVLMLVPAAGITWFNFRALPFLRFYINDVWTGGWMGVLYTTAVHVAFKFDSRAATNPAVAESYVNLVLYGIFPAIAVGALVTTGWSRWRLRPAVKFENLPANTKLKTVHTFNSSDDVEVVARAMRHFNSDAQVLEEKATLGETIIKGGLATFPSDVGLLVLYANFLMEVKRDGPAARTQLQIALKSGPTIVQRYQIFCTIENSKRLKDGQEGSLDLQSYVEFKRNYRAVIRVHKAALAAQREMWQLLLKPSITTSAFEAAMRAMEAAADAAHQVYRRVLDRYPNNGKLLRCYGKFLEDVRNDPIAATRAYAEAARNGGGDGLMALDLEIQGTDKPEFITSMDLHEDACIVVNAEGKILMVNSCVTALLGHPKIDLEGSNVSMIMPQPFSGRHPGYMARYVQGGEPHILDTVRDVVALHKDRYVFPLRMCVTKLSGVGSDAIFLGVLRPEPLDTRNLRAWLAPNGIILCSDPQFASLTGMSSEEMVGRSIQSLVTDIAAAESLLELCRESPFETLCSGTIVRHVEMVHRYLPPIPVAIKVTQGGTDAQRILVLNAHRTDGATEGLMVVDSRGALAFATWDVAAMLGYPLKKFLKMRLEQVLPQPFATMHTKHLKDQPAAVPPTSCRAGALVNLVNSNGGLVPVRLKITTKEDSSGHTHHVVQVAKADASSSTSMFVDKRLALTCTLDGRILSVDQPGSNIFGFPAASVVGSNLADCIDVFSEWRTRAGAHQLELLLLSLLDRETEMPGTSWRVKVHSPDTNQEGHQPGTDARGLPREAAGMSACLQTEIVDTAAEALMEGVAGEGALGLRGGAGGDGGGDFALFETNGELAASSAVATHARIILWRRNLLTGVIEMDEHLVLRKADTSTGLIVGLPPSALPKMPLGRLLELPPGVTNWEDLMNKDDGSGGRKSRKGKSALKGGMGGTTVSVPRAFIGSHPDGGSMRMIVQGVTGAIGGGRIVATLHPDTAYVGARANVYRALGLEALIDKQQHAAAAHGHGLSNGYGSAHGHGHEHGQGGAAGRPHTHLGPPATAAAAAAGLPPKPPRPPKPAAAPPMLPEPAGAKAADGAVTAAVAPSQQQQSPPPASRVRAAVSLGAKNSRLRFAGIQDGDSAGDAASVNGGVGGAGSLAGATMGCRTELPEGGGSRAGSRSAPGSSRADDPDGDGDESSYDSDGSGSELERTTTMDREAKRRKRRRRRRRRRGRQGGEAGEAGAEEGEGQGEVGEQEEENESDDDDDDDSEEEETGADVEHLHRNARNQSDFIAAWVRALSRQMSLAREHSTGEGVTSSAAAAAAAAGGGLAGPLPLHPNKGVAAAAALSRAASGAGPSRRGSMKPEEAGGDGVVGVDLLLQSPSALRPVSAARSRAGLRSRNGGREGGGGGGAADDVAGGGAGGEEVEDDEEDEETEREIAKRVTRMESNKALAKAEEEAAGPVARAASGLSGGDGASSGAGDDDDATSAGGPTFSDASSAVDVDLSVDARRARLLKRMLKLLSGPHLAIPVVRLRIRTVLLLGTMMVTHVVCFVVLVGLINTQFEDVRAVHRLALAADRSQVAVVKAAVAEFCSRPGIEPVSVCEQSLNATVADIRSSLEDLEVYHQGTYLGVAETPRRQPNQQLWSMWTNPSLDYQLYMDVQSSYWANLSAGVWQLGNRFVAAGRELLYWAPQMNGQIGDLRAFHFVLTNGPWSLFRGYTASLDYLAKQALDHIRTLQIGILILLVVEAALVQLACVLYEWWLVHRSEVARRGNMLVGLGLPGPILRILASRPLVVVEDSDDDDDDDNEDEEAQDRAIEGASGAAGGGNGKSEGGAPGGRARRASVSGSAAGGGGGPPGDPKSPRRVIRHVSGSDDDDDDDDDEEDDGPRRRGTSGSAGGGTAGGSVEGDKERAARVAQMAAGGSSLGVIPSVGKKAVALRKTAEGVKVNGRVLRPSPNNQLKFMVPLVLWECALVVVLAVSYTQLERMQEPLVILNMASHVIYRYSRVRMIAFLLVAAQLPAERATWRAALRTEVANLQSEYDALMYGGVAVTQVGSVFDYPVPASTFASATFAANFFMEERCFRWDQSKCYTPDSPYYEVTHHGLDVMMRRILSEMTLLLADEDADATYNGTRYTTMYMVGIRDMYEGIQSSAQLFMDYMLARYDAIKLIHTILLVCTLVLLLGYGFLVLRPYLARAEVEVDRLAGLLSHVPAEMDVLTHTRLLLRSHAKMFGGVTGGGARGRGGGGGGKGRGRRTLAATAADGDGAGGAGGGEDEAGRRMRPSSGLRKSVKRSADGGGGVTGGSVTSGGKGGA